MQQQKTEEQVAQQVRWLVEALEHLDLQYHSKTIPISPYVTLWGAIRSQAIDCQVWPRVCAYMIANGHSTYRYNAKCPANYNFTK